MLQQIVFQLGIKTMLGRVYLVAGDLVLAEVFGINKPFQVRGSVEGAEALAREMISALQGGNSEERK